VNGRWSHLPLRTSLLLGILALTFAALVTTATVGAVAMRAYLLDRTDGQLRGAANLVLAGGGQLLTGVDSGKALRSVIAPTDYLAEVRAADGGIVRLSGTSAPPTRPLLDRLPGGPAGPSTIEEGANRYRVVVVDLAGSTVLVGLPLASVDDVVRRLVVIEALTALAVLFFLAVLARVLVVRRLRPLEAITAAATAISAGQLDRRMPAITGERGQRTEVGRLTGAVDGMLARIQTALSARARSEERLKRFVADASHELRTPLTSVRGYLQLLGSGVVTEHDRPDVLHRLDDETARMAAIVDDLLFLARLDAERALGREPVDLTAVVRDSVADAVAVEPDRRITLLAPESCVVTGDEDSLRQVMANLMANLRAHTPRDAPATVTVHSGSDGARVEVTDHGPGLDRAARERMFDRFYRGDPGRGANGGSGLGLSIVAEVIRTHGGQVSATGTPGGGLTVWFQLHGNGS
jgi:two-component system OmpR family sensor kinase